MNSKAKYNTKHYTVISDYLESNPHTHFTVADVCAHFKSQGIAIGQTTVYRQLERLVDEGLVSKYIIDANSPACFEFTGRHAHQEETCFHCKCEKCGKLIHINCDDLIRLQQHLMEEHSFFLNPYKTVFYGLCDDCRNKEENL